MRLLGAQTELAVSSAAPRGSLGIKVRAESPAARYISRHKAGDPHLCPLTPLALITPDIMASHNSIEVEHVGNVSPSMPGRGQGQSQDISNRVSDNPGLTGQQRDSQVEAGQGSLPVCSGALPWKIPDSKALRKEFRETYTEAEKEKAFASTAKIVQGYSDALVKRWNEEIDMLLVYAGLFSAIVTAFNVQSYLLLQPTPDPTVAVLQQISFQLNSFSVNPPFVNATQPAIPLTNVPPPPVESWAVALNILWFSALICSLGSASIGILVKQWLHEYQTGLSGTAAEIARLRQYRLNHFAGLLVLLWNLHRLVAVVASVLVCVVVLFVAVTTVMPIIWSDCCYLSPPTYALFRTKQRLRDTVGVLHSVVFRFLYRYTLYLETLERSPQRAQPLFLRLRHWTMRQSWSSMSSPTWSAREQSIVKGSSLELDVDMIIEAYSSNMDANHLSATAGVILADQD
ncbi:hypothetical protein BD309DRAFT_971188 [Dichomitus squalens]|nr:hypothetical protein BD309DRAFT_971188 [Dichomitus squalens]